MVKQQRTRCTPKKKKISKMVFSLPLFPFTDFWGVSFFSLFNFLSVAIRFFYIYTAQIIYTTRE